MSHLQCECLGSALEQRNAFLGTAIDSVQSIHLVVVVGLLVCDIVSTILT